MSDYHWKRFGTFGTPSMMEGIGYVIAAWNLCEHSLTGILSQFLTSPPGFYHKVWAITSQTDRPALVRACLPAADAEIAPLIEEYLAHFAICNENRNIVAHATVRRPFADLPPALIKHLNKSTELRVYDLDPQKMLKIADECYQTYQFGLSITNWVFCRRTGLDGLQASELAPLPRIPPKPNKLPLQTATTHSTAEPPPESFQA